MYLCHNFTPKQEPRILVTSWHVPSKLKYLTWVTEFSLHQQCTLYVTFKKQNEAKKKSRHFFFSLGLKRIYYEAQTPKKNGDSSLNHTLLLVSSHWKPVFLFLFNFFVEENGNELLSSSEAFPGLGHSVNIVVFWDYVWSFVSYFISSFWVAL